MNKINLYGVIAYHTNLKDMALKLMVLFLYG